MENIDIVWLTYTKTKEPELRDKLILEYIPLVKIVAGRLSVQFFGHVELEDLVSYGIFGLIDAIDKFNPEKGVKFETYASLRIKGAILDNIRRMDWVPRSLRQDNRKLEQAYNELESKLGREPTNDELSENLGVSAHEALSLIKKSVLSSLVSLDSFLEQNHETPAFASDANGPENEMIKNETAEDLAKAIDKLSEKERLVVTLYYYEELTLKEISKVMGVTESRVSQIHSKAVFKLRTKLARLKNY